MRCKDRLRMTAAGPRLWRVRHEESRRMPHIKSWKRQWINPLARERRAKT